jgi:hypothetical protein
MIIYLKIRRIMSKEYDKDSIYLLLDGFKKTEAKQFVPSIFEEGVYKWVEANIKGMYKDIHTVKFETTLYLTNVLRTLDNNGYLTEKIEDSDNDNSYVIKSEAFDIILGILPNMFFEVE